MTVIIFLGKSCLLYWSQIAWNWRVLSNEIPPIILVSIPAIVYTELTDSWFWGNGAWGVGPT